MKNFPDPKKNKKTIFSIHTDNKLSIRYLLQNSEIIAITLILFIFVSYANTLTNEFVSDDIAGIVKNPSLANFGYFLTHGHPTTILFSLLYNISGLNPFLYHLNSILWHFGVSLLVYFTAKILTRNNVLASITSILFAIHPMHTEAVTWISGLPYVLYSFFGLIAIILYILIDQALLSRWWLIGVSLAIFFSLYSSEKAIVLPIVIIVYGLLFSKWRKTALLSSPLILVTGVYSAVNLFGRIGSRIASVSYSNQGNMVVFNPLIQIPIAITSYIKLLLWPIGLTLYHEDLRFTYLKFGSYAIIFFLFLALTAYFFRKNKTLSFAAAVFLIGLAPTLSPVSISWIVAERYVYFSSWGFFILMAYALVKLKIFNNRVFWGVFVSICVLFSLLTIRRNAEWRNQDTLWPATIRESPTSSRAWNNMGDYYGRHNDAKNAIRSFSRAIELRPRYAEATHNLGNVYRDIGQATKAAELYKQALEYDPNLFESLVNLAAFYIHTQKYDQAEQYLKRAEKIRPNSIMLYNAWGVFYLRSGNKDKAIEIFKKAVALDPNNKMLQNNLKQALAQ